MARIRTIKPDFWKNETLGEMPSDAQLLFIGLWNLADRRGFIEDRPKRIKAELFPYRQMNVDKYLDMLTNGFIRRVNIDGVQYIHVINFTKHQVCNIREPESTVPEQYWNYTCTVPESQEGKGREGEIEREINNVSYSDLFEQFWTEYERKGSKREAFKEWHKSGVEKRPEELERMYKHLQVYKTTNERKFRKDAERYLKACYWEDK